MVWRKENTKVPHRLIQSRFIFQLRHVVGVGHEAHIEHQIRLDGDAVLEAEGQDVDGQSSPIPLLAEQVQQFAAELGDGEAEVSSTKSAWSRTGCIHSRSGG